MYKKMNDEQLKQLAKMMRRIIDSVPEDKMNIIIKEAK